MRSRIAPAAAAFAFAFAFAGMLAACSDDSVWLEPPPDASARSLIIARETSDGLELRALAVANGSLAAAINFTADENATLEALAYRATLAELGLTEGVLEATHDGSGRSVPSPDGIYALRLRSGKGAGWTALPAMSDALAAYRFQGGSGSDCATFDVEVLNLETDANAILAVAFDEHTAIVTTLDGQAYRYVEGGGVTRLEVTPARILYAGARGELGDLWFGSEHGELLRGDLGRDGRADRLVLSSVSHSRGMDRLHWFGGSTTDDGFELFTLSLEGSFERFRLGTWIALAHFPMEVDWTGGLAHHPPDGAIAVWGTSRSVSHARGDSTVSVDTPAQGLSAIAWAPAVGYVAGTVEGGFVRSQGDGFVELPGSPFSLPVTAIAAYRGGFIYTGPFGNLGQYLAGGTGSGFCPLLQPAPTDIESVAILGDDILVTGFNSTFPKTPVTILHRR